MVCSRVRIRSGDASPSALVRTVAGSTIEGVVIGVTPFEWDVRVSSKDHHGDRAPSKRGSGPPGYTTLWGTTHG